MQTEEERARVLAQDGPVREFRVSKVNRYQVTDWTDYRGGKGTRVIAENLTLDAANEIATAFGAANPGSLVNTMEPPFEGSVLHLEPQAVSPYRCTVWALEWGGGSGPPQSRYFASSNECDAIVRMAERVLAMDSDPTIGAAWLVLKRLPDTCFPEGQTLASWTKTSNERPTEWGALTPDEWLKTPA